MNNIIGKFLMKFVAKKLDGKKTYVGASGKILTGIGAMIPGIIGVLGIMFPDTIDQTLGYEESLAAIAAGCALISSGIQGIGLGHKIEKANKISD